ncbi:MAG: UbiA family prenyltransferase [Candidatus Hydrothermarchaeaceae archaeon]
MGRELVTFTRPETSIFIAGMAATGFLLFNPLGTGLVYAFLAVFFLSAFGYSYNYLEDKKEDLLNNIKLNAFVTNGKGPLVAVSLLTVSFIFSLGLSRSAFWIFLISVPLTIAYSKYRIKEVFLLKNVYTGSVMALMFLIGATTWHLPFKALFYLPFVFVFGFVINLLGDIRGYRGDKAAGIKTVAVVLGPDATKKLIHFSVWAFIGATLFLNSALYPLLPFAFAISFFLERNDLKKTRICILLSFMFLPVFLAITKVGVI